MSGRKIDGYTMAAIDLLTALVVCFAALAVLAISAAQKSSKAGLNAGGLYVEARWDMARDADVDLWLLVPGDQPVGYSHTSDKHANLIRDDLGRQMDPESRNQEDIVIRGAPAGEYIADVMAYRSYDLEFPIKVTVTVTRLEGVGTQILSRTVYLQSQGQQITVFRFTLNSHDDLVPGSVNHLPMPLYGGGMTTR